MKLKKALSGILAAAMVVTMVPSMAFASTTNTVTKVPTVAADTDLSSATIAIKVKDAAWTSTEQVFRVTLENAEWKTNPVVSTTVAGANAFTFTNLFNATATAGATFATAPTTQAILAVGDNYAEVSLQMASAPANGLLTLDFPGTIHVLDEDGPVNLVIDALDSEITGGSYTIATVGAGDTVASVSGSVKTYGRVTGKATDAKIEIREASVGALPAGSAQAITFKLPKDVTWYVNPSTNVLGMTVSGTLFQHTTFNKAASSTSPAIGEYVLDESGRNVTIYTSAAAVSTSRRVAVFTPVINIGRDAAQGEIAVSINGRNDVTDASDLVIAKYGDESVQVYTVDEDEIPTIITGRLSDEKDKTFYLMATIKEQIAGSLTPGKVIDFELPKEVQVIDNASVRADLKKSADLDDAKNASPMHSDMKVEFNNPGGSVGKKTDDTSTFSITVPQNGNHVAGSLTWDTDKANTLNIYIPVTVRADYTGDITLKMVGRTAGIEDTELVVAKAVAPITVTTKTTEVKNGVQSQTLADITITENAPGYLIEGKTLYLDIDDLGFNGIKLTDAKASVTDGDLAIKKVETNAGTVSFKVDVESTKASTIEVKGVVAALNRVMPEGTYALNVYGDAVCENTEYNKNKFSYNSADTNSPVYTAVVDDYINIVTPADSTTVSEKVDAKFVIGEASYTNNGAATEMDAAAYIDSHNRTMVPIRYVANACGISENDIRWEAGSQTAIINGLNTVVTVKMGSNKLQTSTGEITMDTVAVNNNGRIYVPVRYIANALGANVSWDAATKTVTLTK